MKVLWLTWKDRKNPLAGGAEVVNEELAKRLAADGHEVIFLVGGFTGGEAEEMRDGFKIVRVGSRFSVYWHAYKYYKKHLSAWPDLVIDEVNTIPFFSKFYAKQKNLLFVHQLCREIWFYEMFFPLSIIGYVIEPIYLWLLRDREVITVSESTKKDLIRFGFKAEKIHIISEGIEIEPLADLNLVQKFPHPTVLALGTIRAMKRTDHIVRAFEIAKAAIPDLELVVAGKAEGKYGEKVLKMLKDSSYASSIKYLGPVSKEKKIELLQKSHVLAVTSIKEGWGLVVTEAGSQGTPAVVYDVDGLRDSVRDEKTGIVCRKNTPQKLAVGISNVLKSDTYSQYCERTWNLNKKITFSKSYEDFLNIITHV